VVVVGLSAVFDGAAALSAGIPWPGEVANGDGKEKEGVRRRGGGGERQGK
jgi:hypothetical protein